VEEQPRIWKGITSLPKCGYPYHHVGAQLIATGRRHAAIYTNDEVGIVLNTRQTDQISCRVNLDPSLLLSPQGLEALAVEVGKQTGDLTFPVPYVPEFYQQEFRSAVSVLPLALNSFILLRIPMDTYLPPSTESGISHRSSCVIHSRSCRSHQTPVTGG